MGEGAPKSIPELGRYRDLVKIGEGSMGSVYEAVQPQIGRTCDSVETVRDVHSLAEIHGLRTPILTTIHGLLFSDEEVPTLVRGLLEDPTSVE